LCSIQRVVAVVSSVVCAFVDSAVVEMPPKCRFVPDVEPWDSECSTSDHEEGDSSVPHPQSTGAPVERSAPYSDRSVEPSALGGPAQASAEGDKALITARVRCMAKRLDTKPPGVNMSPVRVGCAITHTALRPVRG